MSPRLQPAIVSSYCCFSLPTAMDIRQASAKDIPVLTRLVNSAYRPTVGTGGWTSEKYLFKGDRIDENGIRQLMGADGGALYIGVHNQQAAGCVYLQRDGENLYLGLLSVDPGLQAKGIGRSLLRFSETLAATNGCSRIVMTVIEKRTELVNWYVRHGYLPTGEKLPYTEDPLSEALEDIEFLVLAKQIGTNP